MYCNFLAIFVISLAVEGRLLMSSQDKDIRVYNMRMILVHLLSSRSPLLVWPV